MYDRERERALWRQSGARYRVRDEEREKSRRRSEVFETDRGKEGDRHLPLRLAALENEYGNVEFTRQADGRLTVSFAKRQEFKEPVFGRDEEKLNTGRLVRDRTEGMTRLRNSGSPRGAEAFVLTEGKSASRQVGRLLRASARPLEEMSRSMASLLVPVSEDVMAREQMEQIRRDLERTARRALEKAGEKEGEKRRAKDKGMDAVLRAVKSRGDESQEAGSREEDLPEDSSRDRDFPEEIVPEEAASEEENTADMETPAQGKPAWPK